MNNIYVCEEENVELITVELPGVVVHSIYKPPPEPFRLPTWGQRNKPHIVIGDFNSHSTLWGYTTANSELCEAMGGLNQPVTHTQRETTEIIQQYNMEEGIQPGSHPCIFKHFGYVCKIGSGSHPAHTASPYMCDCEPGYCATTHYIQKMV